MLLSGLTFTLYEFYAPTITMAEALSVTCIRHVCPSICTSNPMTSVYKLNSYGQNFMKLGHIVYYHNVFFMFDNGLYHTMLSRVMALCL